MKYNNNQVYPTIKEGSPSPFLQDILQPKPACGHSSVAPFEASRLVLSHFWGVPSNFWSFSVHFFQNSKMTSKVRMPPSKVKKTQGQLFERHVTKDQMERLLRESQIEFQERERNQSSLKPNSRGDTSSLETQTGEMLTPSRP